jgi:Holliday junction resolvasome RuvABC ATP-dependent DNA helicase subunit
VPQLVPYSTPEAVRIAFKTARRLGFGTTVPMPEQGGWLLAVAKACDNNPRRISKLLSNVLDVAVSTDCGNLHATEGYDISQSLEFVGLTPDGLTTSAVTYMLALYAHGGSAGAATVKAILGETALDHTEKALLSKGFIDVGSRGRSLTEFGLERARQLAEETVATHVAREGAVA